MTRTFALAALFLSLGPSAFAQTPVSLATIGINESGTVIEHFRRAWFDGNADFIPQCVILNPAANGECSARTSLTPSISFEVAADPGPGGLAAALVYTLPLSLPAPTQGDVILENIATGDLDVIRFNVGDLVVAVLARQVLPTASQSAVAIVAGVVFGRISRFWCSDF